MARVRRALRSRYGHIGHNGDRGASAIELAVFAFVLLLVSMGIIQFALWFDARHAALAAAADGDRVARDSFTTDGKNWMTLASMEATRYYRSLNTGVLDNVRAVVVPQGSTVSVTISGTLNGIIRLHISETVTGPIECFRAQQFQGTSCAPAGG